VLDAFRDALCVSRLTLGLGPALSEEGGDPVAADIPAACAVVGIEEPGACGAHGTDHQYPRKLHLDLLFGLPERVPGIAPSNQAAAG
jgi:hypothetical protein